MQRGRTALGAVAGVVTAGVVIAAVEGATHARWTGDGPFVGAVLGYGLGAAVGTAVAGRIGGRTAGVVVPVALAVLALVNVFSFAHPLWFVPAAGVALGVGWVAGSRLIRARTA